MAGAWRAVRANEWWEYKLAPLAGTAYATAYMEGVALVDLAGQLLVALLALGLGAAYVSVLNDLTDRELDRRAGKPNRLEGRRAAPWWTLLGAIVAAGAVVATLAWRSEPAVLALYAGAWVAFAAYSVPPLRLKARGVAGVLADAAGAHCFPFLFVAAVVLAEAGDAAAGGWLAAVGAWALGHGVRGALLHQFGDREVDARVGLRTFAMAHRAAARRVGLYAAFPLELAGFGALLVLSEGALAAALLLLYLWLEVRRTRGRGFPLVVVEPAPDCQIALQKYYAALFPLAFLISAALRDPVDALVLAAHVALFPVALGWIAHDVRDELRGVSASRHRASRAAAERRAHSS